VDRSRRGPLYVFGALSVLTLHHPAAGNEQVAETPSRPCPGPGTSLRLVWWRRRASPRNELESRSLPATGSRMYRAGRARAPENLAWRSRTRRPALGACNRSADEPETTRPLISVAPKRPDPAVISEILSAAITVLPCFQKRGLLVHRPALGIAAVVLSRRASRCGAERYHPPGPRPRPSTSRKPTDFATRLLRNPMAISDLRRRCSAPHPWPKCPWSATISGGALVAAGPGWPPLECRPTDRFDRFTWSGNADCYSRASQQRATARRPCRPRRTPSA